MKHSTDKKAHAAKTDTKTAEKPKEEAANAPAPAATGDGSFDRTPTETQIATTAPAPVSPTADGVATKLVRHGTPGGVPGTPTTIVEEAVILDEHHITDDLEKQIANMAVLAQSQGVNQTVILGPDKGPKGEKGTKMLIVHQDGTHTTEFVPDIPEDAK